MAAPTVDIDPAALAADPYPALRAMQAQAPVVRVPQLGGALLMTRHADIAREEKDVATFSSHQPQGLMTVLMGENLMRKDGDAHAAERRATFPAFSPRTVRERWEAAFRAAAARLLDDLAPRGRVDLVADYAMPLSVEALRAITGLHALTPQRMDAVSQAMIDGISN